MINFRRVQKLYFFVPLGLLVFCLGTTTFAQNRRGPNEKLLSQQDCEGGTTTLDITSERMTYESKIRTFIFEEKVTVRRCTMVMTCERLQVISGTNERNVERIIATGQVKFHQGSRHAVAERADYFEAEQKLILSGNPRAWDTTEQNELTGEEMVIFLQEDKLLVKQARVLLPPQKPIAKTP
jgi:lipopolysaccharide export system protein LptA